MLLGRGGAIDTADLESALQRPGADERFRVVEDSQELVDALQWRVRRVDGLPSSLAAQGRPPRDTTAPPESVGGGAESRVVLLHRAKAVSMARKPRVARILITTFTSHLQQDLQHLLQHSWWAMKPRPPSTCETVDGLARDLHGEMTGTRGVELSPDEESRLWDEVAPLTGGAQSARFLRNEYRHVVLAQGVHTLEDYESVSRSGRGVRLSATGRRALWPAFEAFEARTRQAGRYSTLQLTESVASLLQRLPAQMYDHVLVDEAQVSMRPNGGCFGPSFQNRRTTSSWSGTRPSGSMETRSRCERLASRRADNLYVCGATTERRTRSLAGRLGWLGTRPLSTLVARKPRLSGYHSVRHGPTPAFAAFDTPGAELARVVETVAAWLSGGRPRTRSPLRREVRINSRRS